jgi:hypothetical protein
VGLQIYKRDVPNNLAVGSWSAGLQLDDLDIPASELWQYDSQEVTLAALGVTTGIETQFQLTRVAPGAGVNLAGDWDLKALQIEYL